MTTIASRLQQVHARLAAACAAAQRDVHSVTLLAVSKTVPAAGVQAALAAGQDCFGENYVSEALAKMDAVAASVGPLAAPQWHLLGPLQSNKTRAVAERFDWVHGLDRLKTAQRLSEQRPAALAPLQVCIQVNISGEASKGGVTPDEVAALAQAISVLPRLRLRGLMAIPAPASDLQAQRRPHAQLRALLQALQAQGLPLDTLSIGMSADLEAAVLEGATIVRVGTAVFGERA